MNRIKYILTLCSILVLWILFTNCKTTNNMAGAVIEVKNDTTGFKNFLINFEEIKVGCSFNIGDEKWEKFTSDKLAKIERETAIRFLFSGNERGVKTDGGFDDFYFGYRINLGEYTGVIYYRISTRFVGAELVIFDKQFNISIRHEICGFLGEFDPIAQFEMNFQQDGFFIRVIDVLPDGSNNYVSAKTNITLCRLEYINFTWKFICNLESSGVKCLILENGRFVRDDKK